MADAPKEALNHDSGDPLTAAGWIRVEDQKPPLIADTPETDGFFLVLRHHPRRDAPGVYRMSTWTGSVDIHTRYWAPIPAFRPGR